MCFLLKKERKINFGILLKTDNFSLVSGTQIPTANNSAEIKGASNGLWPGPKKRGGAATTKEGTSKGLVDGPQIAGGGGTTREGGSSCLVGGGEGGGGGGGRGGGG